MTFTAPVTAVTLLSTVRTPEPLTAKPAPTETPPTALVVARGISEAGIVEVPVMSPSALNEIPACVPAPPLTALLIPKFPPETFKERSKFEVFNLSAVIVPAVSPVPDIAGILAASKVRDVIFEAGNV